MFDRSDDQRLDQTEFQLVHLDDGRVLMTRHMRQLDAEAYNRQWTNRGVPTRWQRQSLVSVA